MLMIAVIPVMVLGSFYYQYFSGVLLSNVQQRELQNNSQIIYSVDNFFNSIFKISDSLLMNEELMDILQKSYEEQSSPLEGYRGKAQVDKLLYKDGYYLDGRIETIAIFPSSALRIGELNILLLVDDPGHSTSTDGNHLRVTGN